MDATYKANCYKLPSSIITGANALNRSFYVAFAFIDGEYTEDFAWVLTQLGALCDELGIQYPEIILTDYQRALIRAVNQVFPNTDTLLCLWHVSMTRMRLFLTLHHT